MLKNAVILKRVLILAMLLIGLAWVSFDDSKSVHAATTYVCCKDCNAMTEACAENCNDNQACIDACLAEEEHCFEICTNSILLCP